MPTIVPVRDLKDSNKISELCNRENRPVFVTKNGYGDMVIMSMACYEKSIGENVIYSKLSAARADVMSNRTKPLHSVIRKIRTRINVHD